MFLVEFWQSLTGLDAVFAICAIAGFLIFSLWLGLQMIGAIGDAAGDFVGVDGDFDTGADHGFQLLSFHGGSAFLLMFGLVGLALSRSGVGVPLTMIGALVAGLGSVAIMGKVFGMARKLQSSGTVKMDNAVGQLGNVYLTIPEGGTGKVTVAIQGRLMEMEAKSEHGDAIPSGEHIRVVRVIDSGTVSVERNVSE